MEKKTMGAFLAALRKANGYTQQEVADRLSVSNKTVSKWERDEGCPEIMILPAIAELYGVSVDEILRGERITKEEAIKTEKTQERTKYVLEKTVLKFKNLSLAALSTGAFAAVLSYTAEFFVHYTLIWLGMLFVLVLAAASLVIEIIAFNSFNANLRIGAGCADGQTLISAKKKAADYIFAAVLLACVAATGAATLIVTDITSVLTLPLGILIGICAGFFARKAAVKNLSDGKGDIEEYSEEFIKYRRRHVRVTAFLMAVSLIISIAIPFVLSAISCAKTEKQHFLNDVGFGLYYETEEEAKNDYYKLKNFIINGEPLYRVMIEDGLTVDIEEITSKYSKTPDGYRYDGDYVIIEPGKDYETYRTVTFESQEEYDEFRYSQVWDARGLFELMEKDITFDDSTFTVSYRRVRNFGNQVIDIMPVFVLIGTGAALLEAGISVLIYSQKRKKSI